MIVEKKKGQFNNCPFTNVNPQTHIVQNARCTNEQKRSDFSKVCQKFFWVLSPYWANPESVE